MYICALSPLSLRLASVCVHVRSFAYVHVCVHKCMCVCTSVCVCAKECENCVVWIHPRLTEHEMKCTCLSEYQISSDIFMRQFIM